MARRAAQEIQGGEAVAIGSGLPATIPYALPANSGVWFLAGSGAVGYRPGDLGPGSLGMVVDSAGSPVTFVPGGAVVGVAEMAAMLAGGHVGMAFIEAAQVSSAGDFVHWTTAETPGLAAPGFAVDLASGVRRVVALMEHSRDNGTPNILESCTLPIDGACCVSLIVTDTSAIRSYRWRPGIGGTRARLDCRRHSRPDRRVPFGVVWPTGNDL